ncbi:hypothetical protein O3P69_005008 [Scylla paramamosain]|uniref:Uncharacterized protein n=1 Tax=Scylla paramamosain TaxID=85552 RepID=A0AAW0U9I7_SCYPA
MVGRARKRRRGGGEEEEANRGALSDCRPFVWRGRKQDGMKDSHVEEAAVTGEQQRAVALSVTAASPRHRAEQEPQNLLCRHPTRWTQGTPTEARPMTLLLRGCESEAL